jgi:transcriptional regulator with XRE-family HTH domain
MTLLNLVTLGRRIRAERVARRLTLEEVVSRTDFTVSWLSKIENGLLAPSLEGLVRIAEALDCGVEQFVTGLTTPPRYVVNRSGDGRVQPGRNGNPGTVIKALAESWRGRSMQPEILLISTTPARRPAESLDGQRFLFVLEGDAKVTYGEETIPLETGDSLYLDAAIPHSLAAAGRGSARVLSVSHVPGQAKKTAGRETGRQPRRGQARTADTNR